MRIGVVCKKVPAGSEASPPTAGSPLDTQVLAQANRRLGLLSGVFAAAVATLILTPLLLYGPLGWPAPAHLPHFLLAQTVLFSLSLTMALLSSRRVFSPGNAVKVGLLYQIAGALVISVCAFQGEMLLQPVMVKLSWLAVWILLFPLFVPSPPVRSLVISLLCATTAPVVFLTWSFAQGSALPTLPILTETFVPYYVCAGLAVIPAWFVYDLGASASAARKTARQLGSYHLIELLGQGGMGEVWRAEHSLLARPTAIKLVRPPGDLENGEPGDLPREEVLERFAREAQTTAALTSPHTVGLYDYGVTQDGTLYYAMELLDGLDLEALVNRFGPVSPARAIYLLRQACESLAEAHRAGLVHRDIKPANLVACQVGGRVDFVKLLDFGLVRRLRQAKEDATASDPNYLLGTPAFMAPELAHSPQEIDGRADIYALGCVAYWLLTGRLVFEQPTVAAIVADHVHSEPPSPSEKAEQSIPGSLERVVLDCLAKDPDRRPQTADELYWRLGRLDVGRPWTQQQARLWWQARLKEAVGDEGLIPPTTWSSVELPSLATTAGSGNSPEAKEHDEFVRPPVVAVGAISQVRIRARQRAYSQALVTHQEGDTCGEASP